MSQTSSTKLKLLNSFRHSKQLLFRIMKSRANKKANRLIPEFAAESCYTLFCCGSNMFDNGSCKKGEHIQSGLMKRFYDWMGRLGVWNIQRRKTFQNTFFTFIVKNKKNTGCFICICVLMHKSFFETCKNHHHYPPWKYYWQFVCVYSMRAHTTSTQSPYSVLCW